MNRFKILLISLPVIIILITSIMCACSSSVVSIPAKGEVEAAEFQGKKLTPIKDQLNNARDIVKCCGLERDCK